MNVLRLILLMALFMPLTVSAEVTADIPPDRPLKLDPAARKELVRTGEQIATESALAKTDGARLDDLWKRLEAADQSGDERTQQEATKALATKLQALRDRYKRIRDYHRKRGTLARDLLREATPREETPSEPLTTRDFDTAARAWADKVLPQLPPAKRGNIRGLLESRRELEKWAKRDRELSLSPHINRLSTVGDLLNVVEQSHTAEETASNWLGVFDIQLAWLDTFVTAKVEGDTRDLGGLGLRESYKPAERLLKRRGRERDEGGFVGNPFGE